MSTDPRTSHRGRMALRTGLYLSQFLGVGFFFTALGGILRERGASLTELGILNAFLFIAIAKIAWAPLVDRFGSRTGHYRSWLLATQPLMALTFLVAVFLDPVDDLGLLLWAAVVYMVLSSTQDAAADALAVRLEAPAAQPVAAGVAVAASYAGSIIGGGGTLLVYDAFGWAPAVAMLALIAGATAVQAVRFHEGPHEAGLPDAGPFDAGPRIGAAAVLRALPGLLRQPGAKAWVLVVLPLMWLDVSVVLTLVPPLLLDSGWTLSELAVVHTMIGGTVAAAASLAAGPLIARWGHRRSLLVLGALQLLTCAGVALGGTLAAPALVSALLVLAATGVYAMTATAIDAVCMRFTRAAWAATDYSALSAVAGAIAIAASSGALMTAEHWGYPAVMWAGTSLGLLAIPAVALLFEAPARAGAAARAAVRVPVSADM
jgi:MFS family permease